MFNGVVKMYAENVRGLSVLYCIFETFDRWEFFYDDKRALETKMKQFLP
jgi:uncharacterized protein (UPF0371 family)